VSVWLAEIITREKKVGNRTTVTDDTETKKKDGQERQEGKWRQRNETLNWALYSENLDLKCHLAVHKQEVQFRREG